MEFRNKLELEFQTFQTPKARFRMPGAVSNGPAEHPNQEDSLLESWVHERVSFGAYENPCRLSKPFWMPLEGIRTLSGRSTQELGYAKD